MSEVVVQLHEECTSSLKAFRRSLASHSRERSIRFKALWDEFVAEMVEAKGPPGEAVPDSRFHDGYWCSFPGGAMVLVQFKKKGYFFRTVEAIVYEFNFSPGPPG